MRILGTIAFSVVAVTILTQCAPVSRFDWGNYENSLYVFYKSPGEREKYRKALADAIALGRKRNAIAPGLLAELGFLYLEDGNGAEARILFQEEMQLFPESRQFLTGVIERTAPSAPAAGV